MWLYEKNRNNTARYILGEQGSRPLVCIGINPSTAVPGCLDPTLKTVQKMASLRGFDGWLMLNLYPQRATNPNHLHEKPVKSWIGENERKIQQYLSQIQSPTIWAAWGTLIQKRTFLPNCLVQIAELIQPLQPEWITLGRRSKHGHPHHPLYLPHAAAIETFDICTYRDSL